MLLRVLIATGFALVLLGELWLLGVVVLVRLYLQILKRLWRMRRRRRAFA